MALDVRELLRRVRAGETDRAVSRALSVARKTVARYREWAGREGFLEGPLPTDLDLNLKLRGMVPECPLPTSMRNRRMRGFMVNLLSEAQSAACRVIWLDGAGRGLTNDPVWLPPIPQPVRRRRLRLPLRSLPTVAVQLCRNVFIVDIAFKPERRCARTKRKLRL